jgi:methyl-accepting chemotaxis protein
MGDFMVWSIGKKLTTAFGVVLVTFLVVGAVSYDSTVKLVDSEVWVEHTHEVLNALERSLSAMKDAETGQRGYVLTGEARYLEPYEGTKAEVNEKLQRIRALTADNPAQQQRLSQIEPAVAAKFEDMQRVIDLRKRKGFAAARREILTDNGKTAMDQVRRLVSEMEDEEVQLRAARLAEEEALARHTEQTILAGSMGAVLLISLLGIFLTRNIAIPLGEVSAAARQIAAGDLSVDLPVRNRHDEVGALAAAFTEMTGSLGQMARVAEQISRGDLTLEVRPKSEKDTLGQAFALMVQNLRRMTREMQESVGILSSSAQQIVSTTTQVASAATQTATAVTETTTTVEEVKQTAQLSTQKARSVSDSAQRITLVSETGKKSVSESIEAMKQIREQMEGIAESIVRLSEQGQAIGEIMLSVNDLAEQSNLLAVNASIEAAKAGEQGKGFSVVAQEVRNLAEQSKQATVQVRGILNDIQKATNAAVMVTEQGSKVVDAGVRQSEQAGESVQQLAESINEAAQAATQIAASSQQQMVGMDQVAQAMESIKTASAQNVASTRQTETAAKNIGELGRRLSDLVALYKI